MLALQPASPLPLLCFAQGGNLVKSRWLSLKYSRGCFRPGQTLCARCVQGVTRHKRREIDFHTDSISMFARKTSHRVFPVNYLHFVVGNIVRNSVLG